MITIKSKWKKQNDFKRKWLQSSRRGWLTPVLSHHRSCGSASGGSVNTKCAYAEHCLFLATRRSCPLLSASSLSSSRQPLSSNCHVHRLDKQHLSCINRRALLSICFHKLPWYYGSNWLLRVQPHLAMRVTKERIMSSLCIAFHADLPS